MRSFSDAIERCTITCRGHGVGASQDMIRSAIQTAYSKLPSRGHWNWFLPEYRVAVSAPYSTGTLSYSTSTNRVTLAAGTLPTWVAHCALVVGDNCYRINERVSSTVASLDSSIKPTADFSAQTYVIYNDRHSLPSDFSAVSGTIMAYGYGELLYTPIETMPDRFGLWPITASPPNRYSIARLPTAPPVSGLCLWPLPSAALILQMVYQRIPRAIRHTGHDSRDYIGTVAIADVAGTTTITGTSTTFTSDMVGSILRVGSSTELPTGIEGLRPYNEELTINGYTSPTVITASEATAGWSGVHYTISDPWDCTEVLYQLLIGLTLSELSQLIGKPIPVNINALVSSARATEAGYTGPTTIGIEGQRQFGAIQMRGAISEG